MTSNLDTMSTKWSNFKYPIVLACFKFRKRTKIAMLETKALQLQSKFGIDYLTLMRNGAPVKKLQVRLGPTMKEFNTLQDEVEELEESVKEKEKHINEKLGVVVDTPSPPPKLVEKSHTYRNQRDHQAPTSRGPRRNESAKHPLTYINIDESGHTYVGMDDSIKTTSSRTPRNQRVHQALRPRGPRHSKSPVPRQTQSLTYVNIDESGHTFVGMDESIKTTGSERKSKKKKLRRKQSRSPAPRKAESFTYRTYVDIDESIKTSGSERKSKKKKSKSKPKQGKSPEHKKPQPVSYLNIDDTGRTYVCMDESMKGTNGPKSRKIKS